MHLGKRVISLEGNFLSSYSVFTQYPSNQWTFTDNFHFDKFTIMFKKLDQKIIDKDKTGHRDSNNMGET